MKKKSFLFIVLVLAVLTAAPAACYADEAYAAVYGAADTAKTASQADTVRIAFLDTGISTMHIDPQKVASGKNYVFEKNNTVDRVGHGTATASLVLGSAELGINGTCPQATAIPLVVYDTYVSGVAEYGGSAMMAEAIYDAIDVFGCRVINMSIGVGLDSEALRKAVEYAESKGVIIVSSVGNDYLSSPDSVYYPAAYPTVIGVGSADGDTAADFSQRGESVFLLADGCKLKAATNLNSTKYKLLSGTSYSTALVSGVAASMLIECPSLTPSQVREILAESCDDVMAPGRDNDSGYGKLDVQKAIAAAAEAAGSGGTQPTKNQGTDGQSTNAGNTELLSEVLLYMMNAAKTAQDAVRQQLAF